MGAKTQLGGLKVGNIISEYQGSLKFLVTKLPIKDATKVIDKIIKNEKYLFLLIIYNQFIYINFEKNLIIAKKPIFGFIPDPNLVSFLF